MVRRLTAVLLLSASSAAAELKRSSPIEAALRFQAPAGWHREEYANGGGADPVLAFVEGSDRIVLRLFGSPGSAYKTPALFLKSPAASTMGRPPVRLSSVDVAGRSRSLFKRGLPGAASDPHAGGPSSTSGGSELFVILPLGDRFAVLSWARETPLPDLRRTGEKAWKAFLKTVSPAGRKA